MNTLVETQLEFDFVQSWQGSFNFDTSYYFVGNSYNKLLAFTPAHNVKFYKDDREIAKLDWSDGTMRFSGDADVGGQLFFDHIIKQHIQMKLQFDSPKTR